MGTRYTVAISGVNANFLGRSLRAAGITEEDLRKTTKIDFGKEMDTEAKAWKTIWSAGQGVSTVKETLPVATLVEQLREEFAAAVRDQAAKAQQWGTAAAEAYGMVDGLGYSAAIRPEI